MAKQVRNGISLLEFLLVLCIAAVIVLVSAREYLKYTQDKKIATLNNSVQILLNAFQAYYENEPAGCQSILQAYEANPTTWRSSNTMNVSIDDLVAAGYINNKSLVENPFFTTGNINTAFYMAADTSQNPFILNLDAYFDADISNEELQAIAAKLSPTALDLDSSPRQAVWRIVPNMNTAYSGYGMSTEQASLQKFAVDQSAKLFKYGIVTGVRYPCSAIQAYLADKPKP